MAKQKKPAKRGGAGAAFSTFAGATARAAGRPYVFMGCVVIVLFWAACGPLARYSDTWQLIINTSTTIITFLMVFLIQNTQNRDNAAIQAKLDELIRCGDAENRFIGIEHLSDGELESILAGVEVYAHRLHTELRRREQDERTPKRARGA
jgi:low affinity Fe/Cu permease